MEVDSILEDLFILTTAGWLIVYNMMDISHWFVLYVHNLIFRSEKDTSTKTEGHYRKTETLI